MDIVDFLHLVAPGKEEELREHLERKAIGQDGAVREGWMWLALGDALYSGNYYDRARVCYRIAYEDTADGMDEARARAIAGIGNTLLMEMDYLGARDAYLDAVALAREENLNVVLAEILISLADVERGLGQLADAEQSSRLALTLNLRQGRAAGLQRATVGLSTLSIYLDSSGELELARSLLNWASSQLMEASADLDTASAAENLAAARRQLTNSKRE